MTNSAFHASAKALDDCAEILAKVRAALRGPAPHRKQQTDSGVEAHLSSSPLSLPVVNFRQWLPAVGESFEERLALFAKNAAELRAQFFVVDSADGAAAKVREIASNEGWKSIGSHSGALTDHITGSLGLPTLKTDDEYPIAKLEGCDAGISQCDALIAQTGSIMLTAQSAGGRALSVLPPHHVVLATADQLLPDLSAAYAMLRERYEERWPSLMTLITGPSRTGDIERILVLGAHGPKKLTIILINVSADAKDD